MTHSEAPTTALGAGPGFVVAARRVLRPARSAAAPAARGADRDRRHSHRADRRPVPPADPRAGPQPGGRLPRHGEPSGAAQGADAAAAARGGGRLGGSPRRAGAAAARVPADPRDRASGWAAPPSTGRCVRARLPAATAGAAAAAARPGPARPAPGGGAGDRRRSRTPVLHRVVARPLDVEGATRRIEDAAGPSGSSSAGSRRWARGPRSWTCSRPCWHCSSSPSAASCASLSPRPSAPMVIARDTARPAA